MAWLVGAPPAWADEESEAKAACKQIAEGRCVYNTNSKEASFGS